MYINWCINKDCKIKGVKVRKNVQNVVLLMGRAHINVKNVIMRFQINMDVYVIVRDQYAIGAI